MESLNVSSKKEKRIQFLKINNQLHLLTYVKKTSILKLYAFQINGLLSSKTYDLSNEKFGEHLDGKYPLDFTLFGNYDNNYNIKTITYDVPNALEKTYPYAKVYIKDSKILLTSNLFDRETTIITLNSNNSDYEFKTLENKSYNIKDLAKKSNSYIYDNTLFYVYSTNKKINLSIYNLENSTLHKEFNITKEESISFKNTPIIQEGGELDKIENLKKVLNLFVNCLILILLFQFIKRTINL